MDCNPTYKVIQSMGFKLLDVSLKSTYETYYERSGNRISDVHFASRIAWHQAFNYHWAVIEDAMVLISPTSFFKTIHLSMPLGVQDAAQMKRILDILWDGLAEEFSRQTGAPPHLRFLYLEKTDMPLFKFLDGYQTECLMKPDFSDYVYRQTDLSTLQGKFYNGKRNHVNKFMRAYPDYEYRAMTADDQAVCLKLVENWGQDKDLRDLNNLKESDYIPIKTLFDHFDALGLMGGTLWVGSNLVAFSIASKGAKDTAIVHIEKANIDYRGAYAVINKSLAQYGLADYEWINREEDMGIEGLHKAKQSYGPAYMVDKYEVCVTRSPE